MKKRRIIKFLALIVILSLSMTVLVGCGQEADKKTESNEEVEGNDSEAKEDSNTQDVIKVATSGTYYPYTYMEDEELVGFDIDIWEEIGKRLNKEIQWEITSFDGMFGMLDTGKVDAAAHQISVTPEREKKYVFSIPYAYNPYKICVHEDNDDIKEFEDLFGKKLGSVATESKNEYIDQLDPDGKIERVFYGAGGDYMKDIHLKRIDATLRPVVNFEEIKEKGDYDIKLVGEPIFNEENAYPFLKDNEELKQEVDKIIKELHEDGTLTELSTKWLGFDITKD